MTKMNKMAILGQKGAIFGHFMGVALGYVTLSFQRSTHLHHNTKKWAQRGNNEKNGSHKCFVKLCVNNPIVL